MISDFKYTAAVTNTPVLVSDNKHYLVIADAFHSNTQEGYLQMFNVADAGDVTLGTTKPDWVLPIPRLGGHDRIYSVNDYFQGINFPNGLVIAATTTRDGNTALASDVDVNIAMV